MVFPLGDVVCYKLIGCQHGAYGLQTSSYVSVFSLFSLWPRKFSYTLLLEKWRFQFTLWATFSVQVWLLQPSIFSFSLSISFQVTVPTHLPFHFLARKFLQPIFCSVQRSRYWSWTDVLFLCSSFCSPLSEKRLRNSAQLSLGILGLPTLLDRVPMYIYCNHRM